MAVLVGLCIAAVAAPSPAGASGPPLHVPATTLSGALLCHGDAASGPTPVLLVPGTTLTPEVNFSWNYEKVFSAARRAWCAVTLPNHGMSDAQLAGEYVVYAIRTLHAAAHRRISVLGYSQGGMVPRWALKWWPDTRAMVDDLVGIDASNHGTIDAVGLCALGCAPSFWQQRTGSQFLRALNAGAETYAGISYTQVYSIEDEVVVPNFGPGASTALHTGAGAISNIAAQAICPLHLAEHLTMGTIDPIASAVVMDALAHAGPAQQFRIARSVCLRLLMPGVTPAAALTGELRVGAQAATQLALYPHVRAEPPLASYAAAG
jgi:hypothetical protein